MALTKEEILDAISEMSVMDVVDYILGIVVGLNWLY